MSVSLTKIQQQKLAALTNQHGLGFANEEDAQSLDALLPQQNDAQLEINLGHICNNICSFCVSGQLTQQGLAKTVPVDPLRKVIKTAYEKGIRRLIFLGYQPKRYLEQIATHHTHYHGKSMLPSGPFFVFFQANFSK